jgi:hypothetical protein
MDHKIPPDLRPMCHHHMRSGGSIRYPGHDDIPMAMDGDDISICSTKEMEKSSLSACESLATLVYAM